jgi:hypothetical protein
VALSLLKNLLSQPYYGQHVFLHHFLKVGECRRLECEAVWLTGPTRRNIPEDGIIHSNRRETLKSLHGIKWLGSVAET